MYPHTELTHYRISVIIVREKVNTRLALLVLGGLQAPTFQTQLMILEGDLCR